jgi:hypothetical protein
MNLPTNSESNNASNNEKNNEKNTFNGKDREYKEVAVSDNKASFAKNTAQCISKHEQTFCHDVSTASYLRGYN